MRLVTSMMTTEKLERDEIDKVYNIVKNHFINYQLSIINYQCEVEEYQKDWNNVGKVGLFVSLREIVELESYYTDGQYWAYINFVHVSFGCMF